MLVMFMVLTLIMVKLEKVGNEYCRPSPAQAGKGKNRLRFNFKSIYIIKIGVDNLPPRAKLERTKKVFVSWKAGKMEWGR